jgi:copper chaperone CopZ
MKKILSLVLVIALVLGSFSFAFAAPVLTDVAGEDYEEAVSVLTALGVVTGYPDGTYKAERVVTRAEMAKLLVEALGYGQLAGGTAPFSDTAGHWAAGSIGLASGIELVQGYPDGTFKPDATVTFDEAVTMILRALGYTDESLRGAWPTNYKIKAIDLGLYDDTTAQAGGADRGNVAIMLFNALNASQVEVKDGVATEVSRDGRVQKLIDKVGDFKTATISTDDLDDMDSAIDLMPYLYHEIEYYENKAGEVAYVSKLVSKEYVGVVVEPSPSGKLKVEDAAEKTKEFNVTSATALFFNGDVADETEITDLATNRTAEVRVVYDSDNVVKGVVAEQSRVVRIVQEYSSRTPLRLNGLGTGRIDLPSDDGDLDLDSLIVTGAVDTLQEIEEDDIVHVYSADGDSKVKLLVVRNTDSGRFTQRNSATRGVFGGKTYNLSRYEGRTADLTTGQLGDTFDLYLDKDGRIFYMEESSTETTETYAVYINQAPGKIDSDEFDDEDTVVDTYPRIRVFTEGGDVVIYSLAVTVDDLEGTTSTTPKAFGDVKVYLDGDDIKFAEILDGKDLVEIEINSDGRVTSVTKVTGTYDDFDKDDMLVEDVYDVTNSTVIFNVSDDDTANWRVIAPSSLANNAKGSFDYSGFRVTAMTVTEGLETGDIYAVVTSVVDYRDGSKNVKKITALLNGVEVEYLTKAFDDVDYDVEDKVVELTMDGDRVTDAKAVTSAAVKVNSIDSTRIRLDDGKIWTLDSNVAVYIIDDGDYTVGSLADVWKGDWVELYPEDSNGVKVIVLNLDVQAALEEAAS